MLRNYVLIALRNLRKHRLYSFITIGGLAVGLAACLMILLFVRDELSYDRWLPNAERIAKFEITFVIPGREAMELGSTPGPLAPALAEQFSSDVVKAVRVWNTSELIRVGDRQFNEEITYVDPGFFEVFDLPLARGQREAALESNTALLVTESMATKYFGDEPALGKVITIDKKTDYTVVGVLEDLPRNTHLELGFVALFDVERYKDRPWVAENWTSANSHTYALFSSAAAIDRVSAELPAFVDRVVKLDLPGFEKIKVSSLIVFNTMPLLDIHLRARKPGYFKDGGDITTVITFSAIAALILLIACINFVNLATARSMSRAREVAMRKVVGARRGQLVGQFLGEAVLTALVALVIAVALVELALGPYNKFIDKQLSLDLVGDPSLLLVMLGLVATVGVLGGLYPAIFLSRFRPAHVLKANQSSSGGGSTFTRNALVVFQFAVSIGLIVSTAVVYGQTRYARGLDLGFQQSNRLVLRGLADMPDFEKTAATLKSEVNALPGVKLASLSSDAPPLRNNNNTLLYPKPTLGEINYVFEKVRVDHDFFAVYGVEPIAGRLFSADRRADIRDVPEDKTQDASQAIVINRTALGKLGISDPKQAIGVVLWDTLGPEDKRVIRSEIIGVVPDLYLRSIHFHITPMMYTMSATDSGDLETLNIDVEGRDSKATVARIESIWSEMAPGIPMTSEWVDQAVSKQYDAIEKRGHMFGAFAIFAVLIACLGLFGLASFAAERRTKEIGVRKALGAGVIDIVRLLMWQFSKPVLIANAIAWPVAYYVMNQWLETFRYHIELTDPLLVVAIFGGAGLLAMAIAWATVAGQASRVARASPIHALRCE